MPREADVRRDLIDQQLAEAGWSLEKGNLLTEQFLPGKKGQVKEFAGDYTFLRNSSHLSVGEQQPILESSRFADYVLLGTDSTPVLATWGIRS